MKNIDVKSLIIGALLTSTIFLGVAAAVPASVPKDTGKSYVTASASYLQWDDTQVWDVKSRPIVSGGIVGYEPFTQGTTSTQVLWRKRIK
jgi:hypothetical protein